MRIPRLEKTSINQDKLILTFETGELKYFKISDLLKDLNLTGIHVFSIDDLKSIKVIDGVIVFPTVKMSLPGPDGVVEELYDLDPNYTYDKSMSLELSFGQIFFKIRKMKDVSQDTIALKCRVNKSYISKFENDKIQLEWVSIRKLFYLGLNVTLDPSQVLLRKPVQLLQADIEYLATSEQLAK